MELSTLTARTFSPLNGKQSIIPKKMSCTFKRRSQYLIPPLSSDHNSSILFYQPKSNFLKIPSQGPYGRKTIPLLKAEANNKGAYYTSDSLITKVLKFSNLLVRFMIPYIVMATTIAFTSIMARTWMDNAHLVILPKWVLLSRAMTLFIGVLTPTMFVNGINQIYDIEIDKINKPHYPLVSQELSLQSAWKLVIGFPLIGIAISVLLKSSSLLAFVLCHIVLGILYSVPPFSTKKSTVGAILTCAMFTFCTGTSIAARTILGLPTYLSAPMIFITIFATTFTLVCASLKDLHDMEGDKTHNIPTLALTYGPRKIVFFGFGLLMLNYVGGVVAAILMPQVFRKMIMIPAHIILSSCLIFQASRLEKANYNKEVSQSVYESMWKFFGAEFILFLFI